MKPIMTFVVYLILLSALAIPTGAVEKKQKSQSGKVENKSGQQPSKKGASSNTKKYDDFVDKNGNGVDDRKENLKKKPD